MYSGSLIIRENVSDDLCSYFRTTLLRYMGIDTLHGYGEAHIRIGYGDTERKN